MKIAALILLSTAMLMACGDDPEPVRGRLIIVGFDGMDPVLAQGWMDDGTLPEFKRLAEDGYFSPLRTSNPPQSPVAWSEFATGAGPGVHGIYDFLRRDTTTHNPAFSLSESTPPQHVVSLFGMKFPLDSGTIRNRRLGQSFWSDIEAAGGRATVLRVPVTFPPEPIHRMLSGMGVPDLLGTQGTFTMFSVRPTMASDASGARAVQLHPNGEGHIETRLEGPEHPLKPDTGAMRLRMTLDPEGEAVRVAIGGDETVLRAGEWSEWIPVAFNYFGPASIRGIVRLYLVSAYPEVKLYVSPIQVDPRAPVVPLSSPAAYAEELAERFGLYHTIGMPEETWSLNEGHIPDKAWLSMVRQTLKERETIFFDALARQDSQLVTAVFVQTDRVSHMFYRGIDTEHPLHGESGPEARDAIRWIYSEADRILGRVREKIDEEDRLIVLSDHGFAPFRRAVHLNRWLEQQGLLVLKNGKLESGVGFAGVDWTRTQAYALGLNSIFINRIGREARGSVHPDDAASIKQRIISTLPALTDPDSGQPVVDRVFDGATLYPGNANEDAPDLVVGYRPGYRASWQTTLGAVPQRLVDDNDRKWSGDHCITPEAVPGVLFTSFQPQMPLESIADVANYARLYWNQAQ